MGGHRTLAGIAAAGVLVVAACGGGVDKHSPAYTYGRSAGFDYAKGGWETGGSNPAAFKQDCENDVIVDWESNQADPVAAEDPGNGRHKEFIAGCVDGIKAALK